MSDERSSFSRRLADAVRAAGHEPRPGVLERLFNQRYGGKPVAFQTASRWLSGQAIPQQEKLRVLGELFGVQPCVLQYGERGAPRVAEPRVSWPTVQQPLIAKPSTTTCVCLSPNYNWCVNSSRRSPGVGCEWGCLRLLTPRQGLTRLTHNTAPLGARSGGVIAGGFFIGRWPSAAATCLACPCHRDPSRDAPRRETP